MIGVALIFFLLVAAYSLFSKPLDNSRISLPCLFAVGGFLLACAIKAMAPQSDLLTQSEHIETIRLLAEATLVIVLFSDASLIHYEKLKKSWMAPARLLAIGMPLSILFGMGAAALFAPGGAWPGYLLIAAILAATDFAADIDHHRLRREIIVTATTNSLVNRMGPVFAWRASEETGASIGQIARAYTIARESFAMRDTWSAIEALGSKVPANAQYLAYDQTARSLRHLSYWLLANRRRNLHVERTVAEFRPGVREIGAAVQEIATGLVVEHNAERIAQLHKAGLPPALAERIGVLESMEPAFDFVELAAEHRISVRDAARTYYAIGAATGLDWIRTQIGSLGVSGPWQASARSALRSSAARAHRKLTAQVLGASGRRDAARDPITAWIAAKGDDHAQWARMLTDMRATDRPDFATLSVGVEAIRKLADA